jgi:transcriptional regulator with XRE-family HTH domain
MLTRKELGERIAQERKRAGLTQQALADALHMERTAITRVEQGRQGLDTLQLSTIAETLGRPPAIFFEVIERDPLQILLRAPEGHRDEIRRHLELLDGFVRDYEFLLQLDPDTPREAVK